ncbi:MAG: hypothetical protein HC900_09285 [Methylacidiphilales bacterium]|nr:hypothetical protein [Candidatus Methylacidiphilales bacterium]
MTERVSSILEALAEQVGRPSTAAVQPEADHHGPAEEFERTQLDDFACAAGTGTEPLPTQIEGEWCNPFLFTVVDELLANTRQFCGIEGAVLTRRGPQQPAVQFLDK